MLYSLFVHAVALSHIEPINQRQGNTISVQEFIFNKSEVSSYLVVGSSLAYRLSNNNLPNGFWNLSQAGGSSLRGLERIQLSNAIPKLILIETNILERSSGKLKETIYPVDYYLKKHIPITQEKYKPVTYFINLFYKLMSKKPIDSKPPPPMSIDAINAMDALQIEAYSNDLSNDNLTIKNFQRLEKLVNEFQSKDVCIVFFEMPISCKLDSLPKAISIRNMMEEYFPQDTYNYIPKFNCQEFVTTDGVHLDLNSSAKLIDMLINELNIIECYK